MPWNGSGIFSRLHNWVNEAAAGTPILAAEFDEQEQDIVTAGLGNCITRDGQGGPTANIPFNNFKVTGLGNGSLASDSVNYGQVFNNPQFTDMVAMGTVNFSSANLTVATQLATDNSSKAASTAFVQSIAFGGPYSAALAINMFRNY